MVGFDARNKGEITLLYLCRLCTLILREPFQLNCDHRQCKTCIESTEGEMIKCAECSEETPKHEIMPDRGFRNDMKKLSIVCSICEWNGLFKDYEEHLNRAHPNPVCEFCGEKFNSTIKLDEHKQKECTKITVPCALKDYGCLSSVYRIQMRDHYLTDIHQKVIINIISRQGLKPLNEQHEKVSTMDVDMGQGGASSMITATNENISTQMQEVYETINIVASGIQTLNDDTQRLSSDSIRLHTSIESLTQDFASLELSIQEQSAFLDGIKPNQEILQQDVASSKQTVDDMLYVSYDGTLIWKIPNFREKMMDAQSERQTSIYSPPFYSSPTGYKMRARLYLHGDGNARRTHMSLFIVPMRGPNDAILKFPFNYKVTFCLYDQNPQLRHIIDSFRPDIKSNSFERPRSEMNIASGIPKFFPLAMIQQEGNPYVRDDTMFIKVMVDFGDMPKALLPYALSLNPGLPMHIRQIMVKQEAEQRASVQSSQQPCEINTSEVDYNTQLMICNMDGTIIWKIINVHEKMMDAQSERQTSIYSPPFYSSPTGYKMRARLYLHGNGNARRTHMSLFFVLMRGPNDAILKFPFNYKVTFCLYDQTPQLRHIIDSFRPDIQSNSFQRPRSEMNIASGIPKFFPLTMIQQEGNPYVRDDTMFIKVMVDFGDMPTTLLPYGLSLNPGLPMHTQQMMIKQEAERSASQQQSQQTPTSPVIRPITMTLPQNNETQSPSSNVTDDNSTSQDQTNNDNN